MLFEEENPEPLFFEEKPKFSAHLILIYHILIPLEHKMSLTCQNVSINTRGALHKQNTSFMCH